MMLQSEENKLIKDALNIISSAIDGYIKRKPGTRYSACISFGDNFYIYIRDKNIYAEYNTDKNKQMSLIYVMNRKKLCNDEVDEIKNKMKMFIKRTL